MFGVCHLHRQGLLDLDGTLLARLLHLPDYGYGEVVVADGGECALQLAAVFGEYLDLIADVFLVLALDLEGRGQAGRPYFEAVVLGVAVKDFLDPAGYVGAGVYVDALGAVKLDHYGVVGAYSDVDDKDVGVFYRLGYCAGKEFFVNHC